MLDQADPGAAAMIRPIRLGLALALAAALALPARDADAFSYVMMDDADLFDQSEGVARVAVAKVLPVADGDSATRYLVSVQDVLAGPALAPSEILVLPGTFDAPNLNRVIHGVPKLAPGGTFLVFYSRAEDGSLQAQQLTLGLFAREQTRHGHAYVRFLEMSSDCSKHGLRRHFHAPRDPLGFERWLRDRARGVTRAPDYLQPEIAELQSAKFTFSSFPFQQPGPGRWFQFDSNQTLNWTARPDGQANTSFDEFASLQQALAAWTNDAGSRILLGYTGTRADSPACQSSNDPGCFSGHVIWNDATNEIAGSYSCSQGGVLAIGGSLAFSNGQTFNGQTWYPRARAEVVMQDGVGCFMDDNQGADGAEVLTHEIGHTLAFGHSCGDGSSGACDTNDKNQATMRAFAHGDGRGAALGVDDRAGAAVAYPAPPGSNVGPTLTPTPANNSTTNLSGGMVGANVSGSIAFAVSGGSGNGTTSLTCSGTGAVTVTSGSPQSIGVGGTAANVVARITLTASPQQGTVQCTATPQGGMAVNFTFTFTAPAGMPVSACTTPCVFRSSFELGEGTG
jgi:hypothetical protein